RAALDLDGQPGRRRPGGSYRGREVAATQRQMVVLDEHRVVETEPVVHPTTGPDRVLGEHAHAGERLPRVAHDERGPRGTVDVRARQGGDTAEVLEEVQRDPLAGEERPGVAVDRGEHLPGRRL